MAMSEVKSMIGSKSEKSKAIVTSDLLGGSSSNIKTHELDLDLHVPFGWEKCLDLKSGKMYIQRNDSLSSPSVVEHKFQTSKQDEKLEDLNFSPSSSKVSFNPFNQTSMVSSSLPSSNYRSVCTLDKVNLALRREEKETIRKIELPLKSSPVSYSFSLPSSNYQSMCTLDKVSLALERADKEVVRKKELPLKSLSVSYSSSIRDSTKEEENEEKFSSPIAAGCSSCLSYVVVMKHNPKCPKCKSDVSFPLAKKHKNIDLNMSI
ncbi:hypothetical protein VNO78_06638 [Psophocarpus tetragonolobus]|uniref:GIR1-like zinc ribbon domain-containing protein n=1 Tax=Psophocarpus tetragonolobus TaxID=3891 RepID=A0AAN9XSC6_PSOTE